MPILYESSKNVIQYYFNISPTQTNNSISSSQHKLKTLVLQCKIMQHNSGGPVQYWQQNTISNTGKFAKMVHPDFFLRKWW